MDIGKLAKCLIFCDGISFHGQSDLADARYDVSCKFERVCVSVLAKMPSFIQETASLIDYAQFFDQADMHLDKTEAKEAKYYKLHQFNN